MNDVTIFNYESTAIAFKAGDGSTMVNATQMAKQFGKRPDKWLDNQPTQDFIKALCDVRNRTTEELIQVQKGGKNQGTWMHEDVAIEFARWLSPKFAIWCNDRIKELMTKGNSLSLAIPQDFQQALSNINLLTDKVNTGYEKKIESLEKDVDSYSYQLNMLTHRNANLRDMIKSCLNLLDTGDVKSTTQIAEKYDMTARDLFTKLHGCGVLVKDRDGGHRLADKYKGYEMTEYRQFNDWYNGKESSTPYLAWTYRGEIFIDILIRFNFNSYLAWEVLDEGKNFN